MWIPIGGFAIGYVTVIVVFAGFGGVLARFSLEAFAGDDGTGIGDWIAFAFFRALAQNYPGIVPVSAAAWLLVGVELSLVVGWALVVFAAVMASIQPRLDYCPRHPAGGASSRFRTTILSMIAGTRRNPSISDGSGDSLKVSLRLGCNPKARQMRLMVMRLSPVGRASDRVLQRVAPGGGVSNATEHLRLGDVGRRQKPSSRSRSITGLTRGPNRLDVEQTHQTKNYNSHDRHAQYRQSRPWLDLPILTEAVPQDSE